MAHQSGWIGFDLDGTLAEYTQWRGPEHIGAPIPEMVARICLAQASGIPVKIVTARVSGKNPEECAAFYPAYVDWCREHLGFVPEVTAAKDFQMITLYDDRCVAVRRNTGEIIGGEDILALPSREEVA